MVLGLALAAQLIFAVTLLLIFLIALGKLVLGRTRSLITVVIFLASGYFFFSFLGNKLLLGLLIKNQCSHHTDFQLNHSMSARNDGYLLRNVSNEKNATYSGYFPNAVEDLVTGRVAFFEIEDNSAGGVSKYFMADKGAAECVPFSEITSLFEYIPSSQCLAVSKKGSSSAKFVVEGYDSNGVGRNPAVMESSSGTNISRLNERTPGLHIAGLRIANLDTYCPSAEGPRRRITAFTFEDRFGFTLPWRKKSSDGASLIYSYQFFQAGGSYAKGKSAIDYGFNDEYPKYCSLASSRLSNTSYDLYEIEVSAKVDSTSGLSKHPPVNVYVNSTARPLVLHLHGMEHGTRDWNIHLEQGTQLVGVFVSKDANAGNYGKASSLIRGVKESKTAMFYLSEYYSRKNNCKTDDFYTAMDDLKRDRFSGSKFDVASGDKVIVGGSFKGKDAYELYEN